jgi:plastocyanin
VEVQMLRRVAFLAATIGAAAAFAGCGSSNSSSNPTTLSMKIGETGKTASFQAPKTAKGGLVKVELANQGKAPHGVQFIQYTGAHTMADVLQQLGGNNNVIPPWAKLEGGVGSVAPGQTGTATVNLPGGNYVIVDAAALGGPGPSSGPPATAGMTLSGGSTGDLPDTSANVTADSLGDDKFKWEISGLKAGTNQVTFDSKGDNTVHTIIAVPIKGQAPPLSQIQRDLAKNGPPPSYIDPSGIQSSAILDGGNSQTTTLDLKQPGQYLFFCPLHDRDGKGKSHDQEGLLAVQTVK